MKRYDSVAGLISEFENLPETGTIYIEKENISNISAAYYIVLSDAEETNVPVIIDDLGRRLPEFLEKEGVITWLHVTTFQDILYVKFDNNESLSVGDVEIIVSAVEYYLENDDFED